MTRVGNARFMPFFEKTCGEKNPRAKVFPAIFAGVGTLALAAFLGGCASSATIASVPEKSAPVEKTGASDESFSEKKSALRARVEKMISDEFAAEKISFSPDFSKESFDAYVDFLVGNAVKKNVPADVAAVPCAALAVAFAMEKTGDDSGALSICDEILQTFPDSDFAAEALYRRGKIFSEQRRFEAAFDCFSALEDSYPASPRVDDAIAQAYLVTEMVRGGIRPLKGGWLPWFKDRSEALNFYDRLYEMAPHATISPRLLYHKGIFAFELSAGWFSADKTLDAIDAFERMISIYPDAKFVPDAYIELAETYEAGIVGADWDQLSTRRAISYYTDFYSLFPEHPQAETAYKKTEELTNLLAANRVVIGDFYYSRHNNPRAALTFYNEAVTLAPDSPAGKDAQARIERIRRGERSERTLVDWLFGRYPNYDSLDYLDAPSLRPLDEMGFRKNDRSGADDAGSASAPQETANPGEN